MCGIAGFTQPGPDARQILSRMNASIAHRGPDSGDTFVDAGIALGHRRLAIIDLVGGRSRGSIPRAATPWCSMARSSATGI
jgi:asparagine synthase (glutamine-hydrolysing)